MFNAGELNLTNNSLQGSIPNQIGMLQKLGKTILECLSFSLSLESKILIG